MTEQLQQPIQFGKYTLYERIGRGGMADVFKGRIQGPAGFQRVFVVKRILPQLSDDPTFIRMFVEEAKMSARLNHANIVQVFELGSVDGEFFISMEYVPGQDVAATMRALWRAFGPPRPDLVAYIGRETCRALGYAHEVTDDSGQLLGMIHRDVSPSNIMISYEGAVKLLDFGIAKALDGSPDLTKSGTLKGKYAYMAPEQTEGDSVDHRIDIFAAGIVLHEVLTGRRLFKGQNDAQTIERVRRCEVRPPSRLNPACPPELDDIVLRALSRDPRDRFQTAGEMADALDQVVHAAHFTPQHMAIILREAFGLDPGSGVTMGAGGGGGGLPGERRLASSLSNPTLSSPIPSTISSGGRSGTLPPVALSSSRISASVGAVAPASNDTADAATLRGIVPRPLWKRGTFWAVSLLCAAAIGVAMKKGGAFSGAEGRQGAAGVDRGAALSVGGHRTSAKKPHNVPVLIQSEPEGADIYVAGKLESLGTTPRWVTMDLDPSVPARIMVRKAGFQDKAFAVEGQKPPPVQLIPITPNSEAAMGWGTQVAAATAAGSTGSTTAKTDTQRSGRQRLPLRKAKAQSDEIMELTGAGEARWDTDVPSDSRSEAQAQPQGH